jgi:hypothetical protein
VNGATGRVRQADAATVDGTSRSVVPAACGARPSRVPWDSSWDWSDPMRQTLPAAVTGAREPTMNDSSAHRPNLIVRLVLPLAAATMALAGAACDVPTAAESTPDETEATTQAQATTTDLLARYVFDDTGSAFVTDSSGRSNTAYLVSPPYASGGALRLEPSSMVLPIDYTFVSSNLARTGQVTFTSRVFAGDEGPLEWGSIFSVGVAGATPELSVQLLTLFDPADRELLVDVGGGIAQLWLPFAFPSHADTHLAVTYDGLTARVYLEGVEFASLDVGWPIPNDASFTIGRDTAGGRSATVKEIDDVRVYARALTAAEVAQVAASDD